MPKLGFQLANSAPYLDTPQKSWQFYSQLAKAGYQSVQLSDLPLSAGETAAILKSAGLCCAAYQSDQPFAYGKSLESIVETTIELDSKILVVSLLPPEVDTPGRLKEYAVRLTRLCKSVTQAGKIFAYRPTPFDFRDMDGKPVYQRLMELMPKETKLALCIHATFGRANYAEILRMYWDRTELAYFMDSLSLPDGASKPVPLGEGDHNWKPILSACIKAGVSHIFAGQLSWDRDPCTCAAVSRRYLTSLGLR